MSPTWLDRFHGPADFASSPPQIGGSNTKLGDHDIRIISLSFIFNLFVEGPT
jgi:hypothetical protein